MRKTDSSIRSSETTPSFTAASSERYASSGCWGIRIMSTPASTASLVAYPHRAPYAASKWAVIGFTKTLALELGEFGIRANAVCPGCVEGERIEGVIRREAAALGISPEAVRSGYTSQTALRTFVGAQDIADMCLYLCSPSGAKISGQVMTIDGFTENCHI